MTALVALVALLPGCSTVDSLVSGTSGPERGQPGFVRGYLGAAAAEEPRAVLVARDILSAGGSATDAAVAAAFTLAVTMPSRAGLGGGGACLVHEPQKGPPEAVVFPPGARATVPSGADRPAALPLMARGLYGLYTRGGRLPFEDLIRPAEELARSGTAVSRALAQDLAAVAGPLLADPNAQAVFGRDGRILREGDRLEQPDLAATLATLRTAGVGDLYQGGLARRLEEASVPAGGRLTVPEMREAGVRFQQAQTLQVGDDLVAVSPPAADAGLTATAFQAAMAGAAPPAPPTGLLGASTGLVTLDREGGAVACTFTMNNLFGTGRIAGSTGILLAAAPGLGEVRQPLLSTVIATHARRRAFRLAAAGSGQAAAPAAAAVPAALALQGQAPEAAIRAGSPEPGRTVLISCPRYLPGSEQACSAAADPRGFGVALGSGAR